MWRRRDAGATKLRRSRPTVSSLPGSIDGFAPHSSIFVVAPGLLIIVLVNGDRPLMSKQTGPQVSETHAPDGTTQVFRPYERLIEIKVMGKAFQVPEKNTILRCFQYISPETIPYGRFCWNQDCQYCRVVGKLTDEDRPHDLLSCKFLVSAGMEITEISPELKYCLKNKLGK